ncbi:molybdopterin-binding protein [Tritonibacter horizontis]|uniref:Putative molybdopterin binding domain protein n=1 Tax=Tritonibacter horizontis TaxID=1768241 RepID=A0A132BV50_9RHOB|nr:molybdopterin-binding protein [Tritonibacter horizontis]KUP92233.1 putative molybdopterin binding domain protein [Tritonibacter horizontis]
MKFGPIRVQDAMGALVAHSVQARKRDKAEGWKTYKIAKGTLLSAAHIDDLMAAGHAQITVARLDAEDVHEDAAALQVAAAIVPDPQRQGLRISGAGAGRVNLYTTGCGITCVDSARIAALNAVDPMISIATVPDAHRVDEDGMVATIKIISYAVPQRALAAALRDVAGALRLLPPVYATATLIETQVSEEVPSDKGRAAMAGRLDRMKVDLGDRVLVPHRTSAIAEALRSAPGEVLLVLTGSATSDPMDVAPEAVRQAGGKVTRFGMPVDPGNLLFLGRLGEKPVIGLPGCARSPALNGADWVLERVLCGVALTSADIAAMGVGGLLKEIPTRPRPRRPEAE